MHKQRIFVLLKTGVLCLYRFLDKETAVLEHMQYPNQLRVSISISLNATTLN
jgi:hypothetical protein